MNVCTVIRWLFPTFRIKIEIVAPVQIWWCEGCFWSISLLPSLKKPRDGKKIIPRFLVIQLTPQKSLGGPGIKVCVEIVDNFYANLRIHFTELLWDAFMALPIKLTENKTSKSLTWQEVQTQISRCISLQLVQLN